MTKELKKRIPKEIRDEIEQIFKSELEILNKIDELFWKKGYPKLKNELIRKIYEIYDVAYEQGHATGVIIGNEIDFAIKTKEF